MSAPSNPEHAALLQQAAVKLKRRFLNCRPKRSMIKSGSGGGISAAQYGESRHEIKVCASSWFILKSLLNLLLVAAHVSPPTMQ